MGKVASIEKVADELRAGDDELAEWTADRGDGFFLPPNDSISPALRTVSDWASGYGYQQTAVTTFLQVADYWLVAHALAHECTVVTHEVPADYRQQDKDSERLHRPRPALHDPVRNASPRARKICLGNGKSRSVMARISESEAKDAALA